MRWSGLAASANATGGHQPTWYVGKDGSALGALCLYLKTDSFGEYIFDWEWARAYQQYGLSYYPKLVAAVPFTPATGPKLLLSPDVDVSDPCQGDERLAGGGRGPG